METPPWLGKDTELKATRQTRGWVTMIKGHIQKYKEARASEERGAFTRDTQSLCGTDVATAGGRGKGTSVSFVCSSRSRPRMSGVMWMGPSSGQLQQPP